MEWWQIVLTLLVSIVVGGVVGALLSYLISRFTKKRKVMQMVQLIIDEAKERANTELDRQGEEMVHRLSQTERRSS
jgi:membrane protein DedA with SNARE-associated domain